MSPVYSCATCTGGTLKEHRPQSVVLYMGGEGWTQSTLFSILYNNGTD